MVEDYGTGLLNRTTNTAYALDGQIVTLTAVNSATGNQTITYTYGTSLASSGVLLLSVARPDRRGTVRALYYDKLGRQTNDCVTTVGTNTDAGTLQIATGYEVRGMTATIMSRASATQNSGIILNQVTLAYNDFGQVVSDEQSHSGAATGSAPVVGYVYDDGSGGGKIRINKVDYPTSGALEIGYDEVLDLNGKAITGGDAHSSQSCICDHCEDGIWIPWYNGYHDKTNGWIGSKGIVPGVCHQF